MAHDDGQDDAAHGHFCCAYRLATAVGSDPLTANVCASMSHLAGQFGEAPDAVRIAEIGLDRARTADGVARLVARLHAMRARGLALRGLERDHRSPRCCRACTGTTDAEAAEWIAGFDSDRVRSRAFGQLTLARVLVHAGRPDEAAVHGRAVCAVAPSLTSARVRRQLPELGAALHPYRDATEEAGFLGQLSTLPATTRKEPVWPV